MDNPIREQFRERFKEKFARKKKMIICLSYLFGFFLATLIVFVGVSAYSKFKESKYIGQEIESKNTITVSATGEVYTKPDLAVMSFSVVTEAKTVAEAMSENTEKMNRIIAFAKGEGIEDKDLKTTSFNIYPRYEYRKDYELWPEPEGKRVLVGYEVRQTLTVKIRDMEKIGAIIQGATDNGANQVGDLQLTIDNTDEVKKQARGEAIEEAKQKARELALQLGVSLVKITNFSESGVSPYYPYYSSDMMMLEGIGGAEMPEIETGENKITVTVSITYEIR